MTIIQPSTQSTPPLPGASEIYVARQPILSAQGRVHGYELLFRDARQSTACAGSSDACTRAMLNNCLTHFGLDTLVGSHRAYINVTGAVLVQDDYRLLPAERVVIELLESVEVDDQVLAAVRRLKSAGYTLALDDFVFDPSYRPLMALADVIKIDFMACDADQCAAVIKQHARKGLTFLAEKVETHEQHQLAMRLGYGLFQGYYFKRPQMLAGRQLNSAQRSHLRFLAEASRNDPDLAQLEHVLHSDPALAVKLLRYLNSAGVGLGSKVHSLHHAMTLMGAEPLRKWAALVATSCLGQDKPAELMRLSLARARFCELACVEMGQSERSVEFFLLGLLSSLDAMLDQPLDEVLSLLPLDEQIKQTLLGAESALGTLYLLMLACEQGAWDDAQILAQMLSLEPPRVAELSNNAQRWADSMHYVN